MVQLYPWALDNSGPREYHFSLATRIVNPAGEIFYVIVCILPLVIRHANLIFSASLYCHLWPVWLYHVFSILSHNRQDFGGKNL